MVAYHVNTPVQSRVSVLNPMCCHGVFSQVILRGKGNPITLCAVYMAVGRRLGLTFEGINAPAHFMCRLPGAGLNGEDAYVDAFR